MPGRAQGSVRKAQVNPTSPGHPQDSERSAAFSLSREGPFTLQWARGAHAESLQVVKE